MRLTKAEVWQVWASDKRKDRRQFALAFLAMLAVFLLCLCVKYNASFYPDKIVPGAYFRSYLEGIKIGIASLLHLSYAAKKEAVIASIGQLYYDGAFARLRVTLMALIAGAGLAVAGAAFQMIYRNPMASPNMLGATAGVKLGNIVMISLYSTQAIEMLTMRYTYCYILTAICVGGVLLLGKISGDRSGNPSVLQMVMAGSIVSQGLNVFTMYYMYNLEDEDLVLYEELSMGTYISYDTFSLCLFLAIMAVALIPMLLFRYQFNAVALDDMEARAAGMNPRPLRMIGQISGVLMVTAAMIHLGDTGMVAMVIPYWIRGRVGANAKKVIVFSAMAGGSLMMICRDLSSLVSFAGTDLPVGFIMNMFLTPAFMMILARQRRAFE